MARIDAQNINLAMGIPIAGLRTYAGADEAPSPLLQQLITIPGSDPDVWELSQDGALALADLGDTIKNGLTGNKPAMAVIFEALGVLGAHFPELQADIDAIKDRG